MPEGGALIFKGEFAMTAKEELVELLINLSEDQIEKLFSCLSELSSLLEEAYPPCHQAQTMQNQ